MRRPCRSGIGPSECSLVGTLRPHGERFRASGVWEGSSGFRGFAQPRFSRSDFKLRVSSCLGLELPSLHQALKLSKKAITRLSCITLNLKHPQGHQATFTRTRKNVNKPNSRSNCPLSTAQCRQRQPWLRPSATGAVGALSLSAFTSSWRVHFMRLLVYLLLV